MKKSELTQIIKECISELHYNTEDPIHKIDWDKPATGIRANKFKDRFKDKNIDEDDVIDILETNPIHKAIDIIRKKYPQASDQDIDDLIGRFATTPYKNNK